MTPSPLSQSTDRPLKALAIRALAMVMLSTMLMLAKLASDAGVSIPELAFWRQAVSAITLIVLFAATRRREILRTARAASHAKRALLGTVGLACNITSIVLLPLPISTTLGFTAPLFAVAIGAMFMGDRVGIWRWMAVILGFSGVVIVANPWGEHIPMLGLLAGLTSGVLVAVISYQIRDLARTEAPITCVFYFATFGSLILAGFLPFYARPHELHVWILLIATGLIGTLAQLLMTTALRFGQVAAVVVMDYTALIWATMYGWLLWSDLPHGSLLLGAPLIIVAGLIITWREHTLSRQISPTSALDESAIEEAANVPRRERAGT